MNSRIISLVCVAAVVTTSCSRSPSEPEPHIPASWSYEGDSGPSHWNKLDSEYANCGFGTRQSPVDITNTKLEDLPNIVFHYQPSRVKIQNTGHTVQLDVDEGNSIDVNDQTYDLVYLQLHAPSEHTIHGKFADAELHLVHRNAARQLAIVAVLLRAGTEDTVLRNVWNNLPSVSGPGRDVEGTIQLEKLLPSQRVTYRYEGSLTTPPCHEVVTWLVMRDAMHVGAMQLAGFTRIFKMNSRPVQPLNQRTVIQDTSPNR